MAPRVARKRGRKKEKAVVETVQGTEVSSSSTANKQEAKDDDKHASTEVIEAVPQEIITYEDMVLSGSVLMEVYRIGIVAYRYQDADCCIYGKVRVSCEGGDMLFNRPKENPEIISPIGGALTLVGPHFAMQAYDRLTFEVDLWQGEKQLIHDFTDWMGYAFGYEDARQMMNQLQALVIEENGIFAVIKYAVFSHAIVANVEMRLNKHSSKNGTGEHAMSGRIAAGNSMIPGHRTELFNRKREEEPLRIRHGDLLPLSRSLIAVPLGSSLQFLARVPLLSEDILDCEMRTCKTSGVSVGKLTGEYGQIEVTVTWETYWSNLQRNGLVGID